MIDIFIKDEKWKQVLQEEFTKDYYIKLNDFLRNEYKTKRIFPKSQNVFNALNLTPYDKVKVVIIGQDPYFNENQAHGLCFSVEKDIELPPSLKNIFKEINSELGILNTTGNLTKWAEQGVLLLNTVLTVEKGKPNSHKGIGWENFTDKIIEKLSQRNKPIIFVLWGANAKRFEKIIDKNKHYVLTSSHPSPLSAYNGFFGCGHFKKINEILSSLDETPIDFKL